MIDPPAPSLPVALAVTVAALLSVGLLARLGPAVTRRAVLASTPWMVLGGLLHALAGSGAYDGPLVAAFASVLVVPATVTLATVLWLPLVQVGRVRTRTDPAGYLGAAGIGVVVPVLAATVVVGRTTVATLVPLAVAPVVAAVATAAVVVGLGLSAAPELAAARSLAPLALYAQALHAVAVAVAVDALGAPASGPLARLTVGLGASVTNEFGAAWPFLLVKLLAVALLVVALGRLAERRPPVAYLLLGGVTALGLGPAVAVLLSTTVLA